MSLKERGEAVERASDILDRSGRDMLEALVAGTLDSEVLAEPARGKPRARIPAQRQALVVRCRSTLPSW